MNNDNWKVTAAEKDGIITYTLEWSGAREEPPQAPDYSELEAALAAARAKSATYTADQSEIYVDITTQTPEGMARFRLTYEAEEWHEIVKLTGGGERVFTGAAFQDPRVIALASSVTRVPLHEHTGVEYCQCCGRPLED